MGLEVDVDTSEAKKVFDRLGATLKREVRAAVTRSTIDAETHAKRLITGGGDGRIYSKSNPKRQHQASAPGQPPASDTGTLVSSLYSQIDSDGLDALVGSRLAYAAMLEYGTRKMASRPFIVPSVAYIRPIFKKRIAKAVEKAGKNAAG